MMLLSNAVVVRVLKKKKQIGDHALPQRGFGLGTPEGAERGGATPCLERSAQASTREPANAQLQGDTVLNPALVNGKRVDVLHVSGSVGCDVTIVDPTCPSYLGKSESALFRKAEQAKTRKHVLNGAATVPLVMSTFGKLGPAAEGV
jgi:hypothetical protein